MKKILILFSLVLFASVSFGQTKQIVDNGNNVLVKEGAATISTHPKDNTTLMYFGNEIQFRQGGRTVQRLDYNDISSPVTANIQDLRDTLSVYFSRYNTLNVDTLITSAGDTVKVQEILTSANIAEQIEDSINVVRDDIKDTLLAYSPTQPSIYYNGIDAYSEVANNDELNFGTGDFTLFWSGIINEIQSNDLWLYQKGGSLNNLYGILISPNKITFALRDGGVGDKSFLYVFELGEKYSIFGVYDRDGNIKCYINNVLIGASNISANNGSISSNQPFYINTFTGSNPLLKQETQDCRTFNLALTESQIEHITLTGEVPFELQGGSNAEIITDPSFDNPGDWNLPTGFSVTGSQLVITNAVPFNGASTLENVFEQGKSHDISVNVTSHDGGGEIIIQEYPNINPFVLNFSSSGVKKINGYIAQTNSRLIIKVVSGTINATIDSISVKREGNTWGINQNGRGYNTDIDQSGNGNHAIHYNTDISGYLDKDFIWQSDITGDTQIQGKSELVQADYMIQEVIIENTTANVCTLDLGTTAGGDDVFESITIAANDVTTITVNKVLSLSTASALYLNDDNVISDWNSASVNIRIKLKKID